MTRAYYNEVDPFAAQWLRNLISANQIAFGDVDDRSISDVTPHDLTGYTQCHFFAGIGGWSLALRMAGWSDDRPVWTGSCPCQPFSQAGSGGGVTDERHLWPHWFHLIRVARPGIIFGEQVADAIKHGWLDLVSDDLEGEGYAIGAVCVPACGVGAPHIRQRLWFVADESHAGRQARGSDGIRIESGREVRSAAYQGESNLESLVNHHQQSHGNGSSRRGITELANHGVVGNNNNKGPQGRVPVRECTDQQSAWSPSLVDWVYCTDEKWRPVEAGTFPLADGVPGRVGLLRGYGNAIVPEVGAEIIRAYMECRP